jgi:PAS domain S-box-containing protein
MPDPQTPTAVTNLSRAKRVGTRALMLTAAKQLFGWPAEVMLGQTPKRRLLPRECEWLSERIEGARTLSRGQRYEAVRLRRDGLPVHVSISLVPALETCGGINGDQDRA